MTSDTGGILRSPKLRSARSSDPLGVVSASFTLYCSPPGVASTDLPKLGKLDRRRISSLVGLAPYAKDSGKRSGSRSIHGVRSAPRTALYLAAMVGSRFNPELKAMYERLRAAGKPPKLAFIAVARKLLTILNAIERDQAKWKSMTA